MKRCLHCFIEYDEYLEVCPNCGTSEVTQRERIDLMPGTVLAGRYIIGKSVGAGGFGIIYRAWDMNLQSIIAIKEFFPSRLVTRAAGTTSLIIISKSEEEYKYRLRRFLDEARNMAKFSSHKNIPNVFEYFEANATAYIVMELLEGEALNEYLKTNARLDQDFAVYIANEVGNALMSLHENKIIHRDVAPDNIYISSKNDLKIKLLDLGAAKLSDVEEDIIDIILKPGYSPVEQYVDEDKDRKVIDERADLYALGATLYVMLTGVKPDESTNRKIEDKVVPPSELNPEISENLSNAIMKAMAVDKHLRFKNVKEFLAAINGERKVIPLNVEKRRRKIKQIGGIVAALLIVGVSILAVMKYYEKRRLEVELNPATIEVWYEAEPGSPEIEAMGRVKSDFENSFENVEVNLTVFSPSEYGEALLEAYKNGKMPDLFESSDAPINIVNDCIKLDDVYESDQADDCLFLEDYEKTYIDMKQMPLGIEVPVACVITGGFNQVDYSGNTFSNLEEFGTDVISVDMYSIDVVTKNFSIDKCVGDNCFFNNDTNLSAVLLTSTMGIDKVRWTMTNYQKVFAFYSNNEIHCRYIYEWSIFDNDSSNQLAAAKRLLSWMLGNSYQNILMVSSSSQGQIPICKECFMTKASQSNYEGLLKVYNNFVFTQYTPNETDATLYDEQFSKNEITYVNKTPIFLTDLYSVVLNRKPSADELLAGRDSILAHGADEYVRNFFISQEVQNLGLSDDEYVKVIYMSLLGREPYENEMNLAITSLAADGGTRENVLETVLGTVAWQFNRAKMNMP